MQPIKEVFNISHDLKGLNEMAENIRQDFIKRGFVKTNMGWLHRDWIKKGLEMNAIGFSPEYSQPPDYLYFNVIF